MLPPLKRSSHEQPKNLDITKPCIIVPPQNTILPKAGIVLKKINI
jgi:hypothetical protein